MASDLKLLKMLTGFLQNNHRVNSAIWAIEGRGFVKVCQTRQVQQQFQEAIRPKRFTLSRCPALWSG
jgi:hypothetical protein